MTALWLTLLGAMAVALTTVLMKLYTLHKEFIDKFARQFILVCNELINEAADKIADRIIAAQTSAREKKKKKADRPLTRLSVRGLTDFAALLAGRRRPALRVEWRAHLAGESGHDPVTWQKVKEALGFVVSGVRFRLADAADMVWRPADAVLRSRTLSNLFVWGPVIMVLVAIVRHDGRFGLVTDIQDPAALGAFLYGVIRTGRWWRGVKPPEPKATRAGKPES